MYHFYIKIKIPLRFSGLIIDLHAPMLLVRVALGLLQTCQP
jgi:hypothetical protein